MLPLSLSVDDVRHAGEADSGKGGGGAASAAAFSSPLLAAPSGSTAKSASPSGAESSWLQTTCYAALYTLVELFHRFQVSVNFLLPELLSLIASCIDGDSDDLAKIGIKCLVVLCSTCGPQLSVQSWWLVLDSVQDVLRRLQPHQLQSNDTRLLLGLPPVNTHALQQAARKGSKGQPELIASGIVLPPDQEAAATTASPQPSLAGAVPTPSPSSIPPVSAQPLSTPSTPPSASSASAPSSQPPVDGVSSDAQQQAQSSQPTAAAAADSATAGTAAAFPAVPTGVSSSPPVASSAAVASSTPTTVASVGAGAASAAAPTAPPTLPFSSASVGVRSRTSLLLMDSLYEVVQRYFPKRPNDSDPLPPLAPSLAAATLFPAHVDPFHSPTHTQESVAAAQAAGSSRFTYADAGTTASSTPASSLELDDSDWSSSSSSLSPSVQVRRPVDRRVLGHLSCAQFFYALDILHHSLLFSHRFNADLTLRRRLFAAGLVLFEQPNRLPQLFASEAHALQISVLLLASMYKAGIPHSGNAAADTRQPPSFLREAEPASASSQLPPAGVHLSVSTAALSPSSSLESVAALRVLDRADFDCSCWESERRLFALMHSLFTVYLTKVKSGQLSAVESSDEVCVAFIDQVSSLPCPQFQQHLPDVWQPIVDLIEHAQTPPLRAALRRFFISDNVSSSILAQAPTRTQ